MGIDCITMRCSFFIAILSGVLGLAYGQTDDVPDYKDQNTDVREFSDDIGGLRCL